LLLVLVIRTYGWFSTRGLTVRTGCPRNIAIKSLIWLSCEPKYWNIRSILTILEGVTLLHYFWNTLYVLRRRRYPGPSVPRGLRVMYLSFVPYASEGERGRALSLNIRFVIFLAARMQSAARGLFDRTLPGELVSNVLLLLLPLLPLRPCDNR
jgi:hypothetical protein